MLPLPCPYRWTPAGFTCALTFTPLPPPVTLGRPQAVVAYKRALLLDVHCYEAFERLTSHHMLTGLEELAFLETLPFKAQCGEDAAVIKHMHVKNRNERPLPSLLHRRRRRLALPAYARARCLHANG